MVSAQTALQPRMAELADRMAAALPSDGPVDLVEQYARPWSLAVAGMAAEVQEDELARLTRLAGRIFDAACQPFDRALDAAGREAAGELARYFHRSPAIHTQMFTALAHSLPAFLGSAWWTLLEHPAELSRLRLEPELMPRAIDELLRLAGPARAQFRQAVTAVPIGESTIEAQQRVILMLDSANRDPEQFPEPDDLRFDREVGQLALGGGLHACVGGALVQCAAAKATRAILGRLIGAFTAAPVECFAVRYLKSLKLTPLGT